MKCFAISQSVGAAINMHADGEVTVGMVVEAVFVAVGAIILDNELSVDDTVELLRDVLNQMEANCAVSH